MDLSRPVLAQYRAGERGRRAGHRELPTHNCTYDTCFQQSPQYGCCTVSCSVANNAPMLSGALGDMLIQIVRFQILQHEAVAVAQEVASGGEQDKADEGDQDNKCSG